MHGERTWKFVTQVEHIMSKTRDQNIKMGQAKIREPPITHPNSKVNLGPHHG